ncbi:MAG: TIGR04013 family B12-binding domain/radical SAM domain-containing protein [Firmicutes bacterium]|nr:TIGR04013 family B12-binding domain/radical SAM domain-containing protein [Bacillota bacterium]
MSIAIAFIVQNYNKYSFAALAGALESMPKTKDMPIYFLPGKDVDRLAQEVKRAATKYDTLAVCFSFATTNIVEVYKTLAKLRANLDSNQVIYIAGGPHATGDPTETLQLGFDIAVIGEAEETFPELICALSDGLDWRQIKGIAYTDHDGRFMRTGKRRPIDLNRFAPFSTKHNKLSPIEISRGCPHACRFCQTSFIFGGKMRHRKLGEILKYISLSKANGTRDFRFISPNSLAFGSNDGKTVNLAAIEELLVEASKITGKKHLFFGSFPSEVRPEAVSKDALNLITTYTATKQLVVGAQTGSQRMLDKLHREHTVEDVYRAVELILACGLDVSVDFIFGLPGETKADRESSIKMIDNLTDMGAKIHSHTFIPLPGTPLSNAKTGIVDKELSRYLSRLANKGLQFGQWHTQQRLAKEAFIFRAKSGTQSTTNPVIRNLQ